LKNLSKNDENGGHLHRLAVARLFGWQVGISLSLASTRNGGKQRPANGRRSAGVERIITYPDIGVFWKVDNRFRDPDLQRRGNESWLSDDNGWNCVLGGTGHEIP